MAGAAIVSKLAKAAKSYAKDVSVLVAAGSTTEATYYSAVKSLIAAALGVHHETVRAALQHETGGLRRGVVGGHVKVHNSGQASTALTAVSVFWSVAVSG